MAGALLRDLVGLNPLSAHNLLSVFSDSLARSGVYDWSDRIGPALEAYAWLQTHGLLAPSPNSPRENDVISRRGREVIANNSFEKVLRAEVSLYNALHTSIVEKVWPIYLKGDYDIAIAYAFKVVEVRMRERAALDKGYFGERLAKKFFQEFEPPEGRVSNALALSSSASLFIGAFGRYRNEATHEPARIDDVTEAMEVLLLANHCLRIVNAAQKTT
jgi:uncharacterized protein (TIGR02391 family)